MNEVEVAAHSVVCCGTFSHLYSFPFSVHVHFFASKSYIGDHHASVHISIAFCAIWFSLIVSNSSSVGTLWHGYSFPFTVQVHV
jgi:hypothetical protein